MKISVYRHSVCMGDDVFDHTIQYEVPESATFLDLFRDLIRQGYFPSVVGNNVVWAMVRDEEDLMSWKTADSILFSHIAAETPIAATADAGSKAAFRFRYYSSPKARALWIAKHFEGKQIPKSYQAEYKSCHIMPSEE